MVTLAECGSTKLHCMYLVAEATVELSLDGLPNDKSKPSTTGPSIKSPPSAVLQSKSKVSEEVRIQFKVLLQKT